MDRLLMTRQMWIVCVHVLRHINFMPHVYVTMCINTRFHTAYNNLTIKLSQVVLTKVNP